MDLYRKRQYAAKLLHFLYGDPNVQELRKLWH
jgi:hypothetical protein